MKRLYVKDEKGEVRAVITRPISLAAMRRLLLHPINKLKSLRVK